MIRADSISTEPKGYNVDVTQYGYRHYIIVMDRTITYAVVYILSNMYDVLILGLLLSRLPFMFLVWQQLNAVV